MLHKIAIVIHYITLHYISFWLLLYMLSIVKLILFLMHCLSSVIAPIHNNGNRFTHSNLIRLLDDKYQLVYSKASCGIVSFFDFSWLRYPQWIADPRKFWFNYKTLEGYIFGTVCQFANIIASYHSKPLLCTVYTMFYTHPSITSCIL